MYLKEYTQAKLPLKTNNLTRETYRGYRMVYTLGADSLRRLEMGIIDEVRKYDGIIETFGWLYIVKCFFKVLFKYKWENEWLEYVRIDKRGEIIRKTTNSSIKFTMEESVNMIRELKQELDEKKIRFFLYALNHNEDAYSTSKEEGLPFIRLSILESLIKDEDFFPKDAHPSRSGNIKIAQRFFERLTQYQIVPPEFAPSYNTAHEGSF